MLRPEETNYPSSDNLLKKSIVNIECAVAYGRFTFKNDEISKSPKLVEWLESYGWKLELVEGDFREGEPSYWKIVPQ
jgi:hypothetical protein